jgi:aminoglycoside phosphotransferase (APT) family kinase protein
VKSAIGPAWQEPRRLLVVTRVLELGTVEVPRDLWALEEGFAAWVRQRHPEYRSVTVRAEVATAGGYSNAIVFVELETDATSGGSGGQRSELVLRLPPEGPGLFRTYDLGMQVAVQDAARRGGVPVPSFVVVEPDATWIGTPFLLMPRVAGRIPGELAVADEWVMGLGPSDQRRLHEGFLDALALVHASPVDGLADHLRRRGATGTLADEVDWWSDLVDWTFAGATPASVADGFAWCRAHAPDPEPPRGLLWGDVRLGNVVFGDDLEVRAVLDWEMASLGPAESDLAWCTALDEIAGELVGRRVPGFLDRDEVVARHERALGRPLVAFRWFEIFAMLRAAALNLRTAALAATGTGKPPRPPEHDLVLRHGLAAIDAAGTGTGTGVRGRPPSTRP